jgi:hypothetical protein
LYDVIWLLQIEMASYQELEDSLGQENIDSLLVLFDYNRMPIKAE